MTSTSTAIFARASAFDSMCYVPSLGMVAPFSNFSGSSSRRAPPNGSGPFVPDYSTTSFAVGMFESSPFPSDLGRAIVSSPAFGRNVRTVSLLWSLMSSPVGGPIVSVAKLSTRPRRRAGDNDGGSAEDDFFVLYDSLSCTAGVRGVSRCTGGTWLYDAGVGECRECISREGARGDHAVQCKQHSIWFRTLSYEDLTWDGTNPQARSRSQEDLST